MLNEEKRRCGACGLEINAAATAADVEFCQAQVRLDALNAEDAKMVEHLQMTRNQRPNFFYKLVRIYANTTNRTEDEIVAVYNESLEEEED